MKIKFVTKNLVSMLNVQSLFKALGIDVKYDFLNSLSNIDSKNFNGINMALYKLDCLLKTDENLNEDDYIMVEEEVFKFFEKDGIHKINYDGDEIDCYKAKIYSLIALSNKDNPIKLVSNGVFEGYIPVEDSKYVNIDTYKHYFMFKDGKKYRTITDDSVDNYFLQKKNHQGKAIFGMITQISMSNLKMK